MRDWSLDQLTVAGVRPFELVEIAARSGYQAVSPVLGIGSSGGIPIVPLRAGDPDTVEMARRLADTGIFIHAVDGVSTAPNVEVDVWRAGIELVAGMGARNIVLHQVDDDAERGFDRFCLLCDCAADAGMGVLIEFTPLTKITSLGDALAFRERTGRGNVSILVDILHLFRSGGDVEVLRGADPAAIGGAQFNDGPLTIGTREDYWQEAVVRRAVPGEGELPVAAFLASLPSAVVVGIEVPDRSQERSPAEHEVRARRLLDISRGLARGADA